MIDELYAEVDNVLISGRYASDTRRVAALSIDLADLVVDQLMPDELQALGVAKSYLAGNGTEQERVEWVERLAHRLDKLTHEGQSNSRRASACRLVWSALVTTTGLSSLAGEFLIELGTRAGLSAQQMRNVFTRHLPELS